MSLKFNEPEIDAVDIKLKRLDSDLRRFTRVMVGEVQKEIKASIREMSADIRKQRNNVYELTDQVNLLDPERSAKAMLAAQGDLKYLHNRLDLLIHKETVATELVWFTQKHHGTTVAGEIARKVIQAMDMPDHWWEKRKKHSIRQILMDVGSLPEGKPKPA